MRDKEAARRRRARQTRARIRERDVLRLTVRRSNSHMYAQITTPDGSRTLVAASSLAPELRATFSDGGNCKAAEAVGALIAERARAAGIERVAFDRAGYRYHGRVKALAEAARAGGLRF